MNNIIVSVVAFIVMVCSVLVYWAGHNFDSDFGKFMKQICFFDFVVALVVFVYALIRTILVG